MSETPSDSDADRPSDDASGPSDDASGPSDDASGPSDDEGGSVRVTIYTRDGCSLCVTAKETIDRVAGDSPVNVEVDLVDVDEDPELAAEYGERVPYVLVDGHPAFKYEVDERELRLKLLAAS